MGLASLFVDLGAFLADGDGGTAVALVRCDELDAAVTVAVVVPVHKSRYPLARLRLAGDVRRQRKLVRRFASLTVTSHWCRDRIGHFLCLRPLSG